MTSDMPRIVARRPIFRGWNSFEIVTVEAEDRHGRTRRHEREVIDHGHASVVMTVDRERQVAILVRQWRAPLIGDGKDPFLLEACAGIIDPGESPEQSARREAEEEIGLKVGAMRKIGTVVPSAGTLTEQMHLFIADVSAGDRTEDGGGNPQEGEDIEIVEMPLAELYDRARRGDIADAKTLILVQRLMIEEMDARQSS
jgi:nudix-type nucleoside diphosphatase (YffH/AdpP family)